MNHLLRNLVCRRLADLDHGLLVLDDAGRRQEFGHRGDDLPAARVEVRDPCFYRNLAFGGSLGAAEAYIRGYWTCDNLVDLVRIFCQNAAVSAGLENGTARFLSPIARLGHWLRRNTPAGSRRNIAAHYDLGDEFFALFLDETMAYSCAVFPRPDSTLHEASLAKFDHICRKLALTPDDHLLEIGSGWGGFALYAARNFGCRVTTTTISQKQYDHTCRLVADADLDDRVTVLCRDYRDLAGTYDKLVSIEMIEAVGHQYLDSFFACCGKLLKPNGLLALQAITVPNRWYAQHKHKATFINQYVFPGSCLPSDTAMCESITRSSNLDLIVKEDITAHYVKTLAIWRARFMAKLDQVRKFWPGEAFIRTWDLYFASCEAGFAERDINVGQYLFAKPKATPRLSYGS